MRISAGQHMRMDQRMKLSPRMIQSMEILQLPTMALEERIEQEMEENPLLELREERAEAQTRREAEERSAEDDDERPMVVDENASRDFQRAGEFSEQYGDAWSQNTTESADYHPPATRRGDGERDSKMDAMANTASRGPGLSEQLLDQWRFVEMDDRTRRAGEHLIQFIDADGYLRTAMDPVLRQAPPGVAETDLERALALARRHLEPTGVGARDLGDCMRLQIDAITDEQGDDAAWALARRLIDDQLKDIEMNRLPRVARRTGATIEQVKAALARLRRLDPRPGRRLAPDRPEAILPDAIVEYDPAEDRYVAALSRGRQPALRINPQYRKLARDRGQERSTRRYLAKNMGNARWLIDAIEQRNSTLLRVVNVVIDAQREFLDHGPEHLKPLPMVRVADQLGIHVGTVSRAVSEKYMQTPRGIFPLRMLFSGGTESASGEAMSWTAVQAKLRQIVDDEDPAKPFSDDQLVERMKEQGLDIARRTVAKYRQQLNIPTARRRRQY